MKKKLLAILLVVVMVVGAVMLVACNNNSLEPEQLELLITSLRQQLNQTVTSKSTTFSVAASITTFDDNSEQISSKVEWSISGGNDKVKAEINADGTEYTIKIPTVISEELSFSIIATLVKDNGDAYVRDDGSKYQTSWAKTLAANSSSASGELLSHYLPDTIADPQMGTEYNLSIYNPAKNYVYYFKGTMQDSKYYETSQNLSDSVKVKLEQATGGFYISFMDGSTKKYFTVTGKAGTSSGGNPTPYADCSITTEPATVFTLDATMDNAIKTTVVCGDLGENVFYLGSQPKYTTISATSAFYYTGTNAGSVDVSQCVARLVGNGDYNQYGGTEELKTEADIIAALKKLPSGSTLAGGPYSLTGTVKSIGKASTHAGQENNAIVNITVGSGADTLDLQCYYLVGGKLLSVGDVIVVTGQLKNYNGTLEFDEGCTYTKDGKAPEIPGGDSGSGSGGGSGTAPAPSTTPAGAVTIGKTIAELATANGWTNEQQVDPFTLDSVVTVSHEGTANSYGDNTGKYYTSGNQLRFYQTNASKLIISVASGYELVSIKITYAVTNTGVAMFGSYTVESGTAFAATGSSATITMGNTGSATNGQVRVTAIEVVYVAK